MESFTVAQDLKKIGGFGGVSGKELRQMLIKECLQNGQQKVHTPFSLCRDMIRKLNECVLVDGRDLKKLQIAVLFNVEFVETLIFDFGVCPENITFFADSKTELAFVAHGYGIKPLDKRIFYIGETVTNDEKISSIQMLEDCVTRYSLHPDCENKLMSTNIKFDVVVMNPPYQQAVKGGNGKRDLWDKFIDFTIKTLIQDNGYLCAVHPSRWRAPEHKLWQKMKDLQINYLEIHNKIDGEKTFGAITRYDWYVLQNCKNNAKTEVKFENKDVKVIDLKKYDWLPNFMLEEIEHIIAKTNEEKCEVLFSRSAYGSDKKHMLDKKDEKFQYPCIYSVKKDGSTQMFYSSKNDVFFGVPKVIMTCAEHPYPIIDMEGQYGMCQNIFALKVCSLHEAESIVKAVNSDKFKNIFVATKWNNFQINHRMFKYFRKNFWKDFI